jgi:hypothetical protein
MFVKKNITEFLTFSVFYDPLARFDQLPYPLTFTVLLSSITLTFRKNKERPSGWAQSWMAS